MIVCSCNVLTDRAVREALSSAAPPQTPSQVHRHLGCKAQCGRCVRTMREIMEEARPERPAVQAPASKVA
jgi:bacterioferritin-associated ferredoxin